jgi:hypothetical protein
LAAGQVKPVLEKAIAIKSLKTQAKRLFVCFDIILSRNSDHFDGRRIKGLPIIAAWPLPPGLL